jgi:hypothetical protein
MHQLARKETPVVKDRRRFTSDVEKGLDARCDCESYKAVTKPTRGIWHYEFRIRAERKSRKRL